MMWCMHRTNIYLDEAQATRLDRIAQEQGTSRSEVIRALIDRSFASGDVNVEVDLSAIEQSHGALADEEEAARDDGDRSAHLARMWSLRPGR